MVVKIIGISYILEVSFQVDGAYLTKCSIMAFSFVNLQVGERSLVSCMGGVCLSDGNSVVSNDVNIVPD